MSDSVLVYSWYDGSRLRFSAELATAPGTHSKRIFFLEGTSSKAVFRMTKEGSFYLSFLPDSEAAEPKLRGFLFDIQYSTIAGRVVTQNTLGGFRLEPLWLNPEDWRNRADLLLHGRELDERSGSRLIELREPYNPNAKSILNGEWYIYKVSEDDYRFVTGPIKTFKIPARTGTYGLPIVIRAKTLGAVVDKVCKEFGILPDAQREEWAEENVEKGVFVRPTPEEVQLYQMLDEKLPFFLPDEELKQWMAVALSEDGGG